MRQTKTESTVIHLVDHVIERTVAIRPISGGPSLDRVSCWMVSILWNVTA